MSRFLVASLAISCLVLTSCAELRVQTVRGTKTVWLSKNGDAASLDRLTLLNKGSVTAVNDPQFILMDPGAHVYVSDYTKAHCQGRSVYEKVQVKDGNHTGVEGWICGASTIHKKVAAM
jgi:hypothetical protein